MSALINRVPTGRIVSLHAELQYLYWKFKFKSFTLQQMKLDPSLKKTQLDFFILAIKNSKYGRYNGKFDPYLNNELDRSGFHLTQSVERDSQKSKSASECFTALEGLGWIERIDGNYGRITKLGEKVSSLKYDSKNLLNLIQKSVLSYGPFIGLLFECLKYNKKGVIKRSDISIGYTVTGEVAEVNGILIPISTGSQDDSITRTRSALIAWGMTAGFLWPVNEKLPKTKNWHVEALKLLKNKKWTWTKFLVLIPASFFSGKNKLNISHPIGYKWMTKSTKALREKGQESIRNETLRIESKIKNRRFAIVYCLAIASTMNKAIRFSALLDELKLYPDLFVADIKNFKRVMGAELQITITTGMVFKIIDSDKLIPLVLFDIKYLESGAPNELIEVLKKISLKIQI